MGRRGGLLEEVPLHRPELPGLEAYLATQPDPVTLDNLWQLDADPGALDRAAEQWRRFARSATAAQDSVDDAAMPVRGDAWSGDTSDTYHGQREKLGRSVEEVVDAASVFARIAQDLSQAAGAPVICETADEGRKDDIAFLRSNL